METNDQEGQGQERETFEDQRPGEPGTAGDAAAAASESETDSGQTQDAGVPGDDAGAGVQPESD